MQRLHVARHFIAPAEHFLDLHHALVGVGCAFEIHIGAETFALTRRGGNQGTATGAQEVGHAGGLGTILFHADQLLTGAHAAPHFAVNAAGVFG